MVTGVEVVGFVLAAMPLVISAVEHYQDGLKPLKECSDFLRALKSLQIRLKIQRIIYEDSLQRLLRSELSEEEGRSLFPTIVEPSKPGLWGSGDVEIKLRKKLGKDYETFMEVVGEMDVVMKKLMTKLEIDSQGRVRNLPFQIWNDPLTLPS